MIKRDDNFPKSGSPIFRQNYASQYDLLYGDKNYEAECDLIEEIFRRFGDAKVKTILDLGCGTGNHALPLARRGYKVTAIDLSEGMIEKALTKAGNLPGTQIKIILGDIRNYSLSKSFDAVLMMFAVLGYQTTNEDVHAALSCARRHLKKSGLLIFDVWYGPAVLATRPSDRVKIIPLEKGKIIRVASGDLDVRRHLCRIQYHLWHIAGDRILRETEETHEMRYFFPMELEFFLNQAGFSISSLTAFPALDRSADETTWNALIIAKLLNG